MYSVRNNLMYSQFTICMPDRPDEDASLAEIAKWMEDDFWGSFTEGIDEGDLDSTGDEK